MKSRGGGLVINTLLECNLFTVSIQTLAPKHFSMSDCCQKKKSTFLVTMNVFVVWLVFNCWQAAFSWTSWYEGRRLVPPRYMRRKNKTVDVSHLLDAVVFSYVCILKFLFQLNDCMRKNCIFNRWKIKFGKFESLVSVAVSQWKMNEEKEVRRFRLTAVR